jgi:hypothetical protein
LEKRPLSKIKTIFLLKNFKNKTIKMKTKKYQLMFNYIGEKKETQKTNFLKRVVTFLNNKNNYHFYEINKNKLSKFSIDMPDNKIFSKYTMEITFVE